MPELYGKPFKSQLYAKVGRLKHDLIVEKTEHGQTKQRLRHAQAEVAELKACLQQIAGLATQDTANAVRQRVKEARAIERQKEYEAFEAEIMQP
jgi:uncharacterized protein YerC